MSRIAKPDGGNGRARLLIWLGLSRSSTGTRKVIAGLVVLVIALSSATAVGQATGTIVLPTATPAPVWAQPGVEDAVARMRYCLGSMYPESEAAAPVTPPECRDIPVLGHLRRHRQKACEMATGGEWWCSQFSEPDLILPGPQTAKPSQAPKLTDRPASAATPTVLSFGGPPQPDYQSEDEFLTLAAGTWTLNWEAKGPFKDDGFGRVCGFNVSLFDATGENAGGVPGLSETLSTPTNGSTIYPNLPAGRYHLFVYVGCPWSVELVGP